MLGGQAGPDFRQFMRAGELARLRDENRRLKSENHLLKSRFDDTPHKKRYSPVQRLQILWHMAYYRIPRSRAKEHFLIAKSTLYRWLHAAEEGDLGDQKTKKESLRKTPWEIAGMIWDIFEANPHFGRHRIAMILWALGVFVAASTVRDVLLRPKPRTAPAAAQQAPQKQLPRQIVTRHPNHVWSVDRTRVWRWRVWPTWVLAAIDHHSRRIMALCPLEGPNAGWVIDALEQAFSRHGPPCHLITDQESVFTCGAFRDLLVQWQVKQRFGAVSKHGSISVTERLIWSLKHEWLCRVPVIRGLDHLGIVLGEFEQYYNRWRAHSTVGGAVPDLIHVGGEWRAPERTAKRIPSNIERRFFSTARVTAFRLAEAA